MKSNILKFTTLLLLMLVTGVFWGTWFSLSRSIEVFTPQAFLEIGKAIIINVAWPMRILIPSTILLSLINLWVYPVKRSRGFILYCESFVFLAATLLITLIVLVPLDNLFKQWTIETIPSNWTQLRDKWEFYHTIRTFTSMASFGTFLASTLFFSIDKRKD